MIGSRTIEYIISAVDNATRVFNRVDDSMRRQEKQWGQLEKAMGLASNTAVAYAMYRVGKAVISAASDVQQLQVSFEVMLGSAERATQMIHKLSEFATKTPFTMPGVENAARQLLAVGFSANEIIPTLKTVGDVAAGLGKGEEGLQRLILNLGQVKTQGKLTGRELRDFAVLGVPLIEELAKTLGVAKEEIADLTSQGRISDKAVNEAFRRMTSEGGRFADLMSKQNKTLAGQWSNLTDNIIRMARVVGQPFMQPLTDALTKINQKMAYSVGFIRLAISEWNALFDLLKTKGMNLPGAGALKAYFDYSNSVIKWFREKTNLDQRIKALEPAAVDAGEAVGNAMSGLGDDLLGAAEDSEDAAKKIEDAMKDFEDAYGDSVTSVQKDLRDLELSHTEKMKGIQEKIEGVGDAMKQLEQDYAESVAGINAELAGTVVDQEEKVADLKAKMEQFKFAPESLGMDQMVTVIENRMDKLGQFVDKLSARDIHQFNLSGDSVQQIENLLQLKEAEAALQRIQKQGVAAEDDLSEARRRAALSENERRIEDLQKKSEDELADFERKMKNYDDEQKKLEDQRTTAQAVYEAQRNQLQLTLVKMQTLHDGYVLLLGKMESVTADKLKSMKEKLEELLKVVASLNSILRQQGDAGINISASAVGSAARGLTRAQKAYGGMAEGYTIVGESGPELVRFPRGSHVSEAGSTRRRLSEGSELIAGITIQGPIMQGVTIGSDMDIEHVVEKTMEEMARQVRLKRIKQS